MIVRHDIVDREHALQLSRAASTAWWPGRAAGGSAAGRRGCERPGVVLDMGDLDAPRPSSSAISIMSGTPSRFWRCTTMLSVSGRPAARTAWRSASCGHARLRPGDAVAGVGREVLEAQLDVFSPAAAKASISSRRQRAGGDEIAVEASPSRRRSAPPGHDAPSARRRRNAPAARRVRPPRRARDASRAAELDRGALEFHRVGAIGQAADSDASARRAGEWRVNPRRHGGTLCP